MSDSVVLSLWAQRRHVAEIEHIPFEDSWSLNYTAAWQADDDAFPLSPALPLQAPPEGYRSASIRRFLENLLPEGRALDIAASSRGVVKSNVYGLIQALGAETTGAFRFLPHGENGAQEQPGIECREVTFQELDQRIAERDKRFFMEWDGQVRLSVAGYQDKLLVYVKGELNNGARMFLPDYPLASTHILKPQPIEANLAHMVVNEHYCMTLARRLGFPVAEVTLLRTPSPVLAVTRFDRIVHSSEAGTWVERKHIIDVCQACDLPVSYKYERHIGSTGAAAQYRDGVSLAMLFEQLRHVNRKAVDKLAMLRWVLYQFIIGNCDAHGKNFSFHVQPSGLVAAPWYDLVSVVQYPKFSHELAMAFGDEFDLDKVKGFALRDFAQRCDIDLQLLVRESRRMRDGLKKHALDLANLASYDKDEQTFVRQIAKFALSQADKLHDSAKEAAKISPDYL
jgi:serine/threonine-protein kinase HipA